MSGDEVVDYSLAIAGQEAVLIEYGKQLSECRVMIADLVDTIQGLKDVVELQSIKIDLLEGVHK